MYILIGIIFVPGICLYFILEKLKYSKFSRLVILPNLACLNCNFLLLIPSLSIIQKAEFTESIFSLYSFYVQKVSKFGFSSARSGRAPCSKILDYRNSVSYWLTVELLSAQSNHFHANHKISIL